jgi:hypothetical protein
MNLIILGPKDWRELLSRAPKRTQLVRNWLEIQLKLAMLRGEIVHRTYLETLFDLEVLELTQQNQITSEVFLYCREQSKFWPREEKVRFNNVISKSKVHIVSETFSKENIEEWRNLIFRNSNSNLFLYIQMPRNKYQQDIFRRAKKINPTIKKFRW